MSVRDHGAADHVWELLRSAPCLWYKSAKCNAAKYMLAIKRSREDSKYFAVKACLYGFAAFQLGYKGRAKPAASVAAGQAASSSDALLPAVVIPERATLTQAAKALGNVFSGCGADFFYPGNAQAVFR